MLPMSMRNPPPGIEGMTKAVCAAAGLAARPAGKAKAATGNRPRSSERIAREEERRAVIGPAMRS